jgi:hypothetical protein
MGLKLTPKFDFNDFTNVIDSWKEQLADILHEAGDIVNPKNVDYKVEHTKTASGADLWTLGIDVLAPDPTYPDPETAPKITTTSWSTMTATASMSTGSARRTTPTPTT